MVVFDRLVSPALESVLGPRGPLRGLVVRSLSSNGLFDLQLRANPKSKTSWASVYVGLTAVLHVEDSGGGFRLRVHKTHQRTAASDAPWEQVLTRDELSNWAPAIEAYLDVICAPGQVAASFTDNEGRIQGSLCTGSAQPTVGFQREAVMAFRSASARAALIEPFRSRILAAAEAGTPTPVPKWWPGVRNHGAPPRLGLEIDVLGVDEDGRLLVIEVKPPNALEGIAWAPAQVRLYAETVALWLEIDPDAVDRISRMCAQRLRIGLPAPAPELPAAPSLRVVPVVAIGEGMTSPEAFDRLGKVHEALVTAPPHSARIDPMEVWLVDPDGSVTPKPVI